MKDGGHAFPVPNDGGFVPGMSLRAYIAAQSMVGLLTAEPHLIKVQFTYQSRADFCCKQADALIAELEKQ